MSGKGSCLWTFSIFFRFFLGPLSIEFEFDDDDGDEDDDNVVVVAISDRDAFE